MEKSIIKINKVFFAVMFLFILMIPLVLSASNYNVEVIDVSPTNLVPGEETELQFVIENTGNKDIDNLVFSWEDKSGNILPIGSSNTKTIQELDDGDDETISFKVFTSASTEPGLYELTLTLRYEKEVEKEIEQGEETRIERTIETITETSKAGIIVGGTTDFDVSVSDFSSNGLILSIANIGKNPANSVTIITPTQSNFIVTGSSSSIIGNLDKGDYSVASFQITPQSMGNSNLKIEIQYTDTMGTRQTLTKTVEIKSSQQLVQSSSNLENSQITGFASKNSSSGGNTWFLIAFVLTSILTVVLVIILVKRKRKKNEAD